MDRPPDVEQELATGDAALCVYDYLRALEHRVRDLQASHDYLKDQNRSLRAELAGLK